MVKDELVGNDKQLIKRNIINGRSVNSISTRGDRLCPLYYYLPFQIFIYFCEPAECHQPLQYILYGHFIPYGHFPLWTLFHMDILPYGQFADSPCQVMADMKKVYDDLININL